MLPSWSSFLQSKWKPSNIILLFANLLYSDIVAVRLSQMILDRQLNGVLDQGAGCLIVYDETEVDVSAKVLLWRVVPVQTCLF
jgi:hypothetical protein